MMKFFIYPKTQRVAVMPNKIILLGIYFRWHPLGKKEISSCLTHLLLKEALSAS
jgi:hypothetical protein